MAAILLLFLSHLGPTANQSDAVNQAAGLVLVLCARLGLPPEYIQAVFGRADSGYDTGRFDWSTNPDRYLFWCYARYGVWVEWEASPFPRTGIGPGIRVSGGIEP